MNTEKDLLEMTMAYRQTLLGEGRVVDALRALVKTINADEKELLLTPSVQLMMALDAADAVLSRYERDRSTNATTTASV